MFIKKADNIKCEFFLSQTFLERTQMEFNRNYKGMGLDKVTTTVGLNSKFLR